MSIGSFILVKNEEMWIKPHVLHLLPYLDEMVFFDGGSTDGTLEFLKDTAKNHRFGYKINLQTNRDPEDLKDSYVELFNECLHTLKTDLAFFLHPDMFILNPEKLLDVKESKAIALTTNITSYAGEPGGKLFEISGRTGKWKNIYRLNNPDLGAHYHGHYGASNEDVYFSEITGASHEFYANPDEYPYAVEDSGLMVRHFSDVRPYERRLGRMRTCLINQGHPEGEADRLAPLHPRVTLKSEGSFRFIPADYPANFLELRGKVAA